MGAHQQHRVAAAAVSQQRQTALWIIAILLAVIATALVVRPGDTIGLRPAYGDTPMMGGRGVFAFTGQLDKHSYGLFMMDVDSNNIWCYQYVPGRQRLRLVAARSFSYDRYLEDFNCEEPTIAQTRGLLEEQRRIRERIAHGDHPEQTDDALGAIVPTLTPDSETGGRE